MESVDKKRMLVSMCVGGLIALAALLPLGGVLCGALNRGGEPFPWVSPHLSGLTGSAPLALVLQLALYFVFGAVVGTATLPFAQEGRELALRSLGHFLLTAALLAGMAWLLGWAGDWKGVAFLVELLALCYALIWLARWMGWWAEAEAIRKKLGLRRAHSLFHWRETLPYLPFALGLCWVLPALLRALEGPVPVYTGVIVPFLALPVGGLASGLVLGRRQGLCPLYPLACALLYLPTVFLLYNYTALYQCVLFLAALAGNALGALWGRPRKEETP